MAERNKNIKQNNPFVKDDDDDQSEDAILNRCLQHAHSAEHYGANSLTKLHRQGKQLDRCKEDLDDTKQALDQSEFLLRAIKSIPGTISNWFRKAPKGYRNNRNTKDQKHDSSDSTSSSTVQQQFDDSKTLESSAAAGAPRLLTDQPFMKKKQNSENPLDRLLTVSRTLNSMAGDMGNELSRHDEILNELSDEVDDTSSRVQTDTRTINQILR